MNPINPLQSLCVILLFRNVLIHQGILMHNLNLAFPALLTFTGDIIIRCTAIRCTVIRYAVIKRILS